MSNTTTGILEWPGSLGTRPGAPGVVDEERIIASAGFNRWLVPPAALAVRLCVGVAYGFPVFWLPLSKALATAGTGATACAAVGIPFAVGRLQDAGGGRQVLPVKPTTF